ncbi:hypothetical protein DFR50_12066 [Roseiarcus fermentans]|uniref:Uncharacterized protein n=1 Tax=Roseiarcus fermentans TaxID=1473586 RepID=A0A366F6U6_9HYPH|nr:hypothetical protein [Roseiarcus fermentans]RBP09866.1 hypothetical protein DFR50_12066 [Roseiarcus fermentans]
MRPAMTHSAVPAAALGGTRPAARAAGAAVSERDRRFALLVSMMTSLGRRDRPAPALVGLEAAMDPKEQPVVTETNKDRVRAGVTGHNVRIVLIAGVALVVVLFALVDMVMRR